MNKLYAGFARVNVTPHDGNRAYGILQASFYRRGDGRAGN